MKFAERRQKQCVIEAKMGWRGFAIEMGDSVRYEIPGIWSFPGMVRKIRLDLDKQEATITSYHLEIWSRHREQDSGLDQEGADRQDRDRRDRQEQRNRTKNLGKGPQTEEK